LVLAPPGASGGQAKDQIWLKFGHLT
jgi:hypothetical protein